MYFCRAARSLGFDTIVLDPDPGAVAGREAGRHLVAAYDDHEALADVAEHCEAVTVEFENVPHVSLEFLATRTAVRPSSHSVRTAADRVLEKSFLASAGLRVAPWATLSDSGNLAQLTAPGGWSGPGIVKTAQLGYDGHGQRRVASADDLERAWIELDRRPCVVEHRLALDEELSVVVARAADGSSAVFPVTRNVHVDGILDTSSAPHTGALAEEAHRCALTVAEHLDYVGVLGVEFFVVDGRLIVNEIAPRPHNSGHWTIDGAVTSQFDQQVRSLVGAPLGDTTMTSGAVAMVNLLGDMWHDGEPDWSVVDGLTDAHLHLYGKLVPRPGRKMGHLTVCRDDIDEAVAIAHQLRTAMSARSAH
jgi:5-(carboxyamino)imidazole ribonucleotide synthase